MRTVSCASLRAVEFWVKIMLCVCIDTWGHHVASWLHGCDCHEQQLLAGVYIKCLHKGRRAVLWAAYKAESFADALAVLDIPSAAKNWARNAGVDTDYLFVEFFKAR